MKYKARLQIFLCAFCFLFLASCSSRLTEDQARAQAIDKLEKYCKNFKVDQFLVKGPEYLGSFSEGYSYQWMAYLPKEGKTNIDIFISYTGATVKLTTEKVADINESKAPALN